MPLSFSPRVGLSRYIVALPRAAFAGLVVALVWLWAPGGLVARNDGRPLSHNVSPEWTLGAASGPSEDEEDTAPQLEAEGVHPIHPSVELAAFEHIDLTSGNVSLMMPLLNLPGNGLLDLGVTLSFNSKPWTWNIGPGELTECQYYHYPRAVRDASGTKHELAQPYGQTTEYPTTEFWHYNNTTHVLEKPNGTWFYYGQYDANSDGTSVRRPTLESDPFGNTIVYNYETSSSGSRLSSIVQTLEDNRQRVVSFAYALAIRVPPVHDLRDGHMDFRMDRCDESAPSDACNARHVGVRPHSGWPLRRAPHGYHAHVWCGHLQLHAAHA